MILVLVLIHRKKVVETRMMEALAKARETGELPAIDSTETITTTRVHAPKKSIIDEAQEFAAKRRETMELQTRAGAEQNASGVDSTKAAFEDEHGVPENRILTSPFNGKTVLQHPVFLGNKGIHSNDERSVELFKELLLTRNAVGNAP